MERNAIVVIRLFSVECKLLTQKSDFFWFLNQRHEWVQWALKNHSKIWFWLNPFDSFWFNQPNDLPDESSDLCHSQVLFWESKGISYSTDDSFIHGESNYWVNDSELKTAYPLLKRGRCLGKPMDGGLEALDEKRVGKHEYSWCCYVRSYNLNPGQWASNHLLEYLQVLQ